MDVEQFCHSLAQLEFDEKVLEIIKHEMEKVTGDKNEQDLSNIISSPSIFSIVQRLKNNEDDLLVDVVVSMVMSGQRISQRYAETREFMQTSEAKRLFKQMETKKSHLN